MTNCINYFFFDRNFSYNLLLLRRSVLYLRNQSTKPNRQMKSNNVSWIWSTVSLIVYTFTRRVVSSRRTRSFSWHRPLSRSYSWRRRSTPRSWISCSASRLSWMCRVQSISCRISRGVELRYVQWSVYLFCSLFIFCFLIFKNNNLPVK